MSAETTEDVIQIIAKAKEILKVALDDFSKLEEALKTRPIETGLDPAKLDALPWRQYASGEGSWIFADVDGAQGLWNALKQRPQFGRVELAGWIYRLSHGESRDFISKNRKGT